MENNSSNNPTPEVQNNDIASPVIKKRGVDFWLLMIAFVIPFAMTLIAIPIGMLFGENRSGGSPGSSGTIGSGVVARGVADAELPQEVHDAVTGDDTHDSFGVSGGEQETDTTIGVDRVPGDTTFTGDVLQLFRLEWEDAWWMMGEGSFVRHGGSGEILLRYGDALSGEFSAALIGNSQYNLTVLDIYNEIIGVEASIGYHMSKGLRHVSKVNINKAEGSSFGGISVGDTLINAEQQLTNMSDRITGGVVGNITKFDGIISSISFYHIGMPMFSTIDDVLQHLSDVKERTITWTVEIDGIFYTVSLSTLDNTTIDSISIEMLYAEDVEMGYARDPFAVPSRQLLNVYANAGETTSFGVEGLDPQFWR